MKPLRSRMTTPASFSCQLIKFRIFHFSLCLMYMYPKNILVATWNVYVNLVSITQLLESRIHLFNSSLKHIPKAFWEFVSLHQLYKLQRTFGEFCFLLSVSLPCMCARVRILEALASLHFVRLFPLHFRLNLNGWWWRATSSQHMATKSCYKPFNFDRQFGMSQVCCRSEFWFLINIVFCNSLTWENHPFCIPQN